MRYTIKAVIASPGRDFVATLELLAASLHDALERADRAVRAAYPEATNVVVLEYDDR